LSVETPVNLALLVGHSPRGLPPWLSKLSVRSSSSSSPMVGYPWTASRGSGAGRGTAKPATPAKASSRSTSSSWKGSHWPAAKRRCSSTSGVSGSGNRNDGRSWRPGDRLHVGDKIILAT